MCLSKAEQMSYRWNKYYSIIFFLLEQILLGTNIRSHNVHSLQIKMENVGNLSR